jgi:hypothetical protein
LQTIWQGTLKKMRVEATDPVSYFLTDGWWEKEHRVTDHHLNPYLGQNLTIHFSGSINCVSCGRSLKKTFNQGFCFPCAQSRPEADICMIKPELCHHGDTAQPCRDETFAQTHCFKPHVLYCSLTSGVKVGITRQPNVPSRWIDQGAVAAVPVAVLPDRRTVGLVEKRLSEEGFKDKTHWTKMLKSSPEIGDFAQVVHEVLGRLEEWGVEGIVPYSESDVTRLTYPVSVWPTKVKSFNLDKVPEAGGLFQGIKGQYLIFDGGVINLRKYAGYKVEVKSEGI